MKVVIVDDEPLARERLMRLLEGEPDIEIVEVCADGHAAISAVARHRPDVLLLDVQMPGLDGFQTLAALDRENLPLVVFVTAFDHHAVRAFEERALDYLLKPTTRERLAEALSRVRERLRAGRTAVLPQALLDLLAERAPAASRLRRIPVRQADKVAFVPVTEVGWIEAAGNYIVLHADDGQHICRETLSALENSLPLDFLRVSRSAIVNLARVVELHATLGRERVAVLRDGTRIAVTRNLREIEEKLRFL